MTENLNGERFAREFAQAYWVVREKFKDKEEWSRHFSNPALWTRLMLKKKKECPERIQDCKPVLSQVASKFALHYQDGEPLHLDAVFAKEPRWAPMCVAIEHENKVEGFYQEIQKLISVRCPLKVGITYTPYSQYDNTEKALQNLCQDIKQHWDRMCLELGGEPEGTEYLFLVGDEVEAKEWKWYYKSFRVGDGYQSGFQPVRLN
jgi:hypothetical protein